jgi:aminopeptidase C
MAQLYSMVKRNDNETDNKVTVFARSSMNICEAALKAYNSKKEQEKMFHLNRKTDKVIARQLKRPCWKSRRLWRRLKPLSPDRQRWLQP